MPCCTSMISNAVVDAMPSLLVAGGQPLRPGRPAA
jgi:hypothetical protein